MQKVGMEMDVWATLAARVSCLAISHTSAYFIVGSLITFASPDGVENYCSRAKTIVLPLVKPSQQWRSRPLLDEGPSHFLFFFFFSFSVYWQIFSFHITNKLLFITVCLKAPILVLIVMNFVLCNLYFCLPSFLFDLLTTGTKRGGKAALVFFYFTWTIGSCDV